jgi:transposase-like protein
VRQSQRNGVRGLSVLTEVAPQEIAVPRDRDGSFNHGSCAGANNG